MNKTIFMLIAILIIVLPETLVADSQQRGGGVVAHWNGTYTQMSPDGCSSTGGCVGDMVSCQANETLLTAKFNVTYWRGICDDRGQTPCAGRLTGLVETCRDATIGGQDVRLNGALLSFTDEGKVRSCFDSTAFSDCTGSVADLEAAGVILAKEGNLRNQFRLLLTFPPDATPETPPSLGVIQITSKAPIKKTRPFNIDGVTRRIKARETVAHITAQPDQNFDNCGGTGCGVAGTEVQVR